MRYNENDLELTKALWWQLLIKRGVFVRYYERIRYEDEDDEKILNTFIPVEKTLRITENDISTLTGKKLSFTFRGWTTKLGRDGCILRRQENTVIFLPGYDPSLYIPFEKCPECKSTQLKKIQLDIETMTEGQWADYMAGNWGSVSCLKCGETIDYGF